MSNQLKCPSVEERIKKMWSIYTTEYYSALTMKKKNPAIYNNIDGPGQKYVKCNKLDTES